MATISKEQWADMYDVPTVQDWIEYCAWLAAYEGEPLATSGVIKVMRHGKSRAEQLRKYNEKKKDPLATFRPYSPLKASAKTRTEVKRRAAAEGISSEIVALCGHEALDGRKCWLPPHPGNPDAHRF